MSNLLTIVHDFASFNECCEMQEKYPPLPIRQEIRLDFTHPLVKRCSDYVRDAYGDDQNPDHAIISVMPPGDSHVLHADNRRRTTIDWEPNHTPWREYSSVLFLGIEVADGNGPYGGELIFPFIGVSFNPAHEGVFVLFSAGLEHQVNIVKCGYRYAIVMWYSSQQPSSSSKPSP